MKKSSSFVIDGERIRVELEIKPAQRVAPYLTIDLDPVPADAVELSISGECDGSAGQCTDTIRELGADVADVQRLCDIWDRWHLNGMKPGTRAQMECLAQHADELKHAQTTGQYYDAACEVLRLAGLLTVESNNYLNANGQPVPYKYGSAWLFEPVSADVVAEATAILDRLNGKRFGEAPDVDHAPDLDGDVIDSRDVIKRLEIYREAVESLGFDPDDLPDTLSGDAEAMAIIEEFKALSDLESEASGYAPDWRYGESLIAESYFTEYAEQLAKDCGMIDRNARWPNNHIDWEAAADELKADYTEVTYRGETYLIR